MVIDVGFLVRTVTSHETKPETRFVLEFIGIWHLKLCGTWEVVYDQMYEVFLINSIVGSIRLVNVEHCWFFANQATIQICVHLNIVRS